MSTSVSGDNHSRLKVRRGDEIAEGCRPKLADPLIRNARTRVANASTCRESPEEFSGFVGCCELVCYPDCSQIRNTRTEACLGFAASEIPPRARTVNCFDARVGFAPRRTDLATFKVRSKAQLGTRVEQTPARNGGFAVRHEWCHILPKTRRDCRESLVLDDDASYAWSQEAWAMSKRRGNSLDFVPQDGSTCARSCSKLRPPVFPPLPRIAGALGVALSEIQDRQRSGGEGWGEGESR